MYTVAASLETKEPIMMLNQPIGFDKTEPGAPYIDGALFQSELYDLDAGGYNSIRININSPGGNVVEGFSICEAMLKTKTPVDTYCGGIAASMAASVFLMGRKRIMADYASLMIHNPFGDADNKMLKAMRGSLVTMLSQRAKCSPEDIAKMMDKETWLSAEEALDIGFCTAIEKTAEINQHRMPRASIRAMWKEASNIQNNINDSINNKNQVMSDVNNNVQGRAIGTSLIAAYLELNTEATENAVLTAVKTKINTEVVARMKAEEELENCKSELQRFKDSHAKKEGELNDKIVKLEAEIKDAKEAKDKADSEAKASAANALAASVKAEVDKFVAAKRIKPEQADSMIAYGKANGVDAVKALLGDIPANAQKPADANITTSNEHATTAADPNKVGMSAPHLMAKIQAGIKAKAK